ncbi:RNA 2'-phosphotransferase [Bradyrhizobium sp. SBR1B]|uniref:RNA 2'-phosphotransferase n=1 Tax=Bradyrhizobium sp. SBR1B TaxID=2663836 RepID=UPI003908A353
MRRGRRLTAPTCSASSDEATAQRVGQRHGKPHIFRVDAGGMHAKGLKFYRADNGVWLTDHVPPEFLS